MSDFSDLERPLTRAPRMGPRERTRYVPNHTSFGLFIKSEQVRNPTAEVAQEIAALAAQGVVERSEKEIQRSRGLHARVRKGFRVKKNAGFIEVGGNVRAKVEVVNDAEGSALLEFGARGLSRLRMLARAGAKFGDFKPEGGPT